MKNEIRSINEYSSGAMKLLKAGEKLFGEHGIDAVSLRQIVASAGLKNSYSIQHHFGSKEGLVQAIYDYRAPILEEGCRQRLVLEEQKNPEVPFRGLLAARFLPLLDSFDIKTRKSFMMFLQQVLHRTEKNHPYFRSRVEQPTVNEIRRRMLARIPGIPEEVFNSRGRLATDLFLGAVVEKQRLLEADKKLYAREVSYWDEVLEIMEAIYFVPYSGGKN